MKRNKLGNLVLGGIPRVVGTISSTDFDLTSDSNEIPCDIVEVRLDEQSHDDWLNRCIAFESLGLPIILTLRLKAEGGGWASADRDRLPIFESALDHVSAIDVELKSKVAKEVSMLAKRSSKACVVSFHDFVQTPPLSELKKITAAAQRLGTITKISTMIRSDSDVVTLHQLLECKWENPICVIGMGSLGTQTRVVFPTMGSCLTYGYLDKPSAPGQLPSSMLIEQLRQILPKFNEDYIIRKGVLEMA